MRMLAERQSIMSQEMRQNQRTKSEEMRLLTQAYGVKSSGRISK